MPRPRIDHRRSVVGLALSIRDDIRADDGDDPSLPVRRAAELAHRFGRATGDERRRMVAARAPKIGDQRWDAFVAGLTEWLAVQGGVQTPGWTHEAERYLDHGWWVSRLPSMRAWEYAGTPLSLKVRGVYLHHESLTNV